MSVPKTDTPSLYHFTHRQPVTASWIACIWHLYTRIWGAALPALKQGAREWIGCVYVCCGTQDVVHRRVRLGQLARPAAQTVPILTYPQAGLRSLLPDPSMVGYLGRSDVVMLLLGSVAASCCCAATSRTQLQQLTRVNTNSTERDRCIIQLLHLLLWTHYVL